MHTREASFEGGYCKLRTARQKKRLQKEDYDKQLLRLHHTQERLYRERLALPLVALEQPYQRGWKRTFVLREDVSRSSQAGFYETLLSKINTVAYAAEKSFKIKRRRRRRKVYGIRPQDLREFHLYEWSDARNKLTAAEKAHFYLKECRNRHSKTMTLKYAYREPWRFVLRIRPHMITHVKMIDEVLEQQISRISNYIAQQHLQPRIQKLTNGRGWNSKRYCGEAPRYKNPFKNKPLHRILYEATEDLL